jgi:hypothetical protein
MNSTELLRTAHALDAALWAESLGLRLDPWQQALLRSDAARSLVLCSRQAGKTLTAALLALHLLLFRPRSLALALSPALRQSGELVRRVKGYYHLAADVPPLVAVGATHLELANGSRLLALPGTETTTRGFASVDLLLIDEASRVADALFNSMRPVLAVSRGRLVALSTPAGKRGWFHHAWGADEPWERVEVRGHQCPRFSPEFLDQERREMGPRWFAQEYGCSFEDDAGNPFDMNAVRAAFDPAVQPLAPPPAPARPAWMNCLTPEVTALLLEGKADG